MLPVVVYVVYVVVFPNARAFTKTAQCVRVCNEFNASLFFSLRHNINKRSEFLFVSFDTLNMTLIFI